MYRRQEHHANALPHPKPQRQPSPSNMLKTITYTLELASVRWYVRRGSARLTIRL